MEKNIIKSLVPISQFNKGQASKIFDRLDTEESLVVLKNNRPRAVILSPDEYERLTEIEEDYILLEEAYRRLEKNGEKGIPLKEVLAAEGITQEEIDGAEEVEIE